MKMVRRQGWRWKVTCYYNEKARSPRRRGDLAVETVHRSDSSMDVEVRAARLREDIGQIRVVPIDPKVWIEVEDHDY